MGKNCTAYGKTVVTEFCPLRWDRITTTSGLYPDVTHQLHALGKSFCKATMANLPIVVFWEKHNGWIKAAYFCLISSRLVNRISNKSATTVGLLFNQNTVPPGMVG
jgi:hypothetical protein